MRKVVTFRRYASVQASAWLRRMCLVVASLLAFVCVASDVRADNGSNYEYADVYSLAPNVFSALDPSSVDNQFLLAWAQHLAGKRLDKNFAIFLVHGGKNGSVGPNQTNKYGLSSEMNSLVSAHILDQFNALAKHCNENGVTSGLAVICNGGNPSEGGSILQKVLGGTSIELIGCEVPMSPCGDPLSANPLLMLAASGPKESFGFFTADGRAPGNYAEVCGVLSQAIGGASFIVGGRDPAEPLRFEGVEVRTVGNGLTAKPVKGPFPAIVKAGLEPGQSSGRYLERYLDWHGQQMREFDLAKNLKNQRGNIGAGFAGGMLGEISQQYGYGRLAAGIGVAADGIGGYAAGGKLGAATNLAATVVQVGSQMGVSYMGGNEMQSEGAGRLAGLATASLGGPQGAIAYGVSTVASDVGSISASYVSATGRGADGKPKMTTSQFLGDVGRNYAYYFGRYFGW